MSTKKIKEDLYVPKDDNDLFDNPMVRAAMNAMSEEQKEKYRILGEGLYGSINFEDEQYINNMPPAMTQAIMYIENQITSGLHPSMLESNEKELLKDAYGETWYSKWGYVEGDLTDIVTLHPNLHPKLQSLE
jgi:hypothetical protein